MSLFPALRSSTIDLLAHGLIEPGRPNRIEKEEKQKISVGQKLSLVLV
jgi:hypothetical protein